MGVRTRFPFFVHSETWDRALDQTDFTGVGGPLHAALQGCQAWKPLTPQDSKDKVIVTWSGQARLGEDRGHRHVLGYVSPLVPSLN